MDITNEQRARILVEALPYIQSYDRKIVVIKYGGSAMQSEELKNAVMRDIVLLSLIGVRVVLIHGGGPEINEMLKLAGKKSEFINGLRVTDRETAELVEMVLSGKISKGLVNHLERIGGKAMSLSGADGKLIEARVLDEKLGYVGEITSINIEPILDLLEKGYIPVISTVARDSEGNIYNINADTAAARIAGALSAESLILMTDTAGILRDKNDESTIIPEICTDELPGLLADGTVSGGMIPKSECCVGAIADGVKKVIIIDGRIPHSILVEMLTDSGIGTMFRGTKK